MVNQNLTKEKHFERIDLYAVDGFSDQLILDDGIFGDITF